MTETVTVYRREDDEFTFAGSVDAESASEARDIARRLFRGDIELREP